MKTRNLVHAGTPVSALGLGCMGMSDFYGPADRDESLKTLGEALRCGVTLLDTGDFYGMGENELLIRELLKIWPREQLFIAVKFGAQRDPARRFVGLDCSPAAVQSSLAYTLTRLGTDYVDLYQPARVDASVPIEDTIGAIAQMQKAGHVRHIGLSEAGAQTIGRAHRESPISWLQIEYSLLSRGIESQILPACRERNIAINAYGVLSRGLLSDSGTPSNREDDYRSQLPRFQGANFDRNRELLRPLRDLADEKGASLAQLAIAWVLARGDDMIPLVGARRRDRLRESLGALKLELTDKDMALIDRVLPPGVAAGERYDSAQMAMLDSES